MLVHRIRTTLTVALLSLWLCVSLSACTATPAAAAKPTSRVPDRAWQYQRLLIRSALAELGTDEHVASLAGQTYQESNWRNDLTSRVGAIGPSQFMPSTARWFIKDMARGLACTTVNDFLDYACAIPAQVRYMAMLRRGVKGAVNECERWAMAMAKYNGGGIKADRRLARANGSDYGRWFNHTELFNGRKRAKHHRKGNHRQ